MFLQDVLWFHFLSLSVVCRGKEAYGTQVKVKYDSKWGKWCSQEVGGSYGVGGQKYMRGGSLWLFDYIIML